MISAQLPVQVLLVDDESRLRAFLKEELEAEHYQVELAWDVASAWDRLQQEPIPDLLVLDWSLPDGKGPDLCKRLREAGITVPVLMLTGHDEISDRVLALDAGVDDYLVKPFSTDELLARLRALQRRRWQAEPSFPDQLRQLADLEVNLDSRQVSRSGQPLDLFSKEYALLYELMRAEGDPRYEHELVSGIWGDNISDPSALLAVYMQSLRCKLDSGRAEPLIMPCNNKGWRLAMESTPA